MEWWHVEGRSTGTPESQPTRFARWVALKRSPYNISPRRFKGPPLFWELAVAAGAWGDGIAVGAGFWVAEEGADTLIEFGADDVLELAGLVVGFGVFDGEGVFE
jgi:hypothetical protein